MRTYNTTTRDRVHVFVSANDVLMFHSLTEPSFLKRCDIINYHGREIPVKDIKSHNSAYYENYYFHEVNLKK